MRWADLDLLGHVNNVVYVDYLQEARVDLMSLHLPGARAPDLGEGIVVVRHEVGYRSPLTYSREPVMIETWVTQVRAASFTFAYEIVGPGEPGDRVVYAQASTVLSPYVFGDSRPRRIRPDEQAMLEPFLEPPVAPPQPRIRPVPRGANTDHFPLQVRFSDVDVYGHVNNVTYFEYLQEARLVLLERLVGEDGPPPVVVAQIDVDYRMPILLRPEPYDIWSVISRFGRTSLTVDSEICDGDQVLARARVVIVLVDPVTGVPREPSPDLLSRLQSRLVN